MTVQFEDVLNAYIVDRLDTPTPTYGTWLVMYYYYCLYYSWHDGQRLARRLKIGRSPVQVLPETNFWIMIKLPVNQLGSKAASDSTLKQLTLAGYQILVLYFTFFTLLSPSICLSKFWCKSFRSWNFFSRFYCRTKWLSKSYKITKSFKIYEIFAYQICSEWQ